MFSEDIEYWASSPEGNYAEGPGYTSAAHQRAVDFSYRQNCGTGTTDSAASPPEEPSLRDQIQAKCKELSEFLLRKNDAYGNSVIASVNVFSQLSADEAILVRLDDKLTRIKNGKGYPGDNDVADLIGYLMIWATKHNIEFK